jgi:hypothetical protein
MVISRSPFDHYDAWCRNGRIPYVIVSSHPRPHYHPHICILFLSLPSSTCYSPILNLTPILLSPPSHFSPLPHTSLPSLIPLLSSSSPSPFSPLPHPSSPLPHHTPRFSWRVLWFVGIPTGLIMLPLCNNIPESFRFLVVRHSKK